MTYTDYSIKGEQDGNLRRALAYKPLCSIELEIPGEQVQGAPDILIPSDLLFPPLNPIVPECLLAVLSVLSL